MGTNANAVALTTAQQQTVSKGIFTGLVSAGKNIPTGTMPVIRDLNLGLVAEQGNLYCQRQYCNDWNV